MSARIAVLASGRGSNLGALLEYLDDLGQTRGGEVVLVASNRADAGALDRARTRGIAAAVVDGPALAPLLHEHGIELVVLAGYLKRIPLEAVAAYRGRIVNVHPALLPAFGGAGMYGERVHRAVLASGVRVTGVTAHFVDEEYDRGRIIAQWPVPVFPRDDVHTLAARVLRVEHLVFPRVVEAVAAGRITLDTCGAAGGDASTDVRPAFTLLPHDTPRLAENIALALGC